MAPNRFDCIMEISPRRFHISASPPYGFGIVFSTHTADEMEKSLFRFSTVGSEGIRNCKPGIWQSAVKKIKLPAGQLPQLGPNQECFVYWVSAGTIDLAQPVEEWATYDRDDRGQDATIDIDKILPEGVNWAKAGSTYDDGGVCSIVSTEYLTRLAAKKVMFGDSDENVGELDYEYYLERIELNHRDGKRENVNFTLGGMTCMCPFWLALSFSSLRAAELPGWLTLQAVSQDSVGGPPYIAVARENGQAIAIKLYAGEDAPNISRPNETEFIARDKIETTSEEKHIKEARSVSYYIKPLVLINFIVGYSRSTAQPPGGSLNYA
jgi:hypothetical protein